MNRRWRVAALLFGIGCGITSLVYLESRATSARNAVSIAVVGMEDRQWQGGALRLGAFNIAHGRGGALGASNWDGGTVEEKVERLERIGEALADLDIVVLNEVDFSSAWSGNLDQASIVARTAGFSHIVRQRNVDLRLPFFELRFGNAILSRFPILDAERVTFEPMSRLETLLAGNHDSVRARIELAEGEVISVWALHLESRSFEIRLRAAERIAERVRSAEEAVFLLGDLNSTWEPRHVPAGTRTAIRLLVDTGRFEAYPPIAELDSHPTFPSEKPDRTIDWILHPRDWHRARGRVVASDLSDHLLVEATVVRSEDRAGAADVAGIVGGR